MDLNPQMFEVTGAFRHLTGFTSICLLPVTLGFSKIFNPKIMFYVVMVDSDRTQVLFLGITGPGAAQQTGRLEVRIASLVCPRKGDRLGCCESASLAAGRCVLLSHVKKFTFLKPGKHGLNPSGLISLMWPHNYSISPQHKSCVSGSKSPSSLSHGTIEPVEEAPFHSGIYFSVVIST